jgi:hypothetical protein
MRRLFRLAAATLLSTVLTALPCLAAELIMFHDVHCVWCARFDAEIGPIYAKTKEGQRAPLRRVDAAKAIPPELGFIEAERLTPVFVLIDNGREIGRIRGYPGEDHFWGLLGTLLAKLPE